MWNNFPSRRSANSRRERANYDHKLATVVVAIATETDNDELEDEYLRRGSQRLRRIPRRRQPQSYFSIERPAVAAAMAMRGLSRFVHETSALFHGTARTLGETTVRWRQIMLDLGKTSDALFRNMSRLTLKTGREGIMLGRLEARQFVRLLRIGDSVRAFERATGARVLGSARSAFQQLDRTSRAVMPDWRVIQHGLSGSRGRERLLAGGKIRAGERVVTADRLLDIVKSDRELVGRAERTMSRASKTKKLLYLGGAITIVGGGIAFLTEEAVRHAARNSGCFMYTTNNGGSAVRKCRVAGCSCPIRSTEGVQSCSEAVVWERMRLANTACGGGGGGGADHDGGLYCVHCDWDEQDERSVNFVDRAKLPVDAYVQCESQDALDALHDIIDGTLGDVLDPIRHVGKEAKASLTDSFRIVPLILSIIGIIVAIIVGIYVYRFAANFTGGGGNNDRRGGEDGDNHGGNDGSSTGSNVVNYAAAPQPIRIYR